MATFWAIFWGSEIYKKWVFLEIFGQKYVGATLCPSVNKSSHNLSQTDLELDGK